MLAVINATIVMMDHLIPNASIVIEDGKIVDFGKKIGIPENAEIIDAKGKFAGPGLIDIHTHATGKFLFDKEPEECERWLLSHGVTSVLPALYFSMDQQGYLTSIETICEEVNAGRLKNFAGFYMEGPYLNAKFGATKENNPWIGAIKKEDFEPIIKKAGKNAKVWAVAPEREGILEFVKCAKEENPSAVFAVAHSEATPEQIEELMPYGLKIGTHHTNATGTLENYPECRGVCVDEAVNYNDGIYAELICDSLGIHVNPYMLRLVAKIKGKEKIILISDADLPGGPPIPGCEDAHDLIFDFSGEIAGTQLTLDVSCRNMMTHTGCSVCDCFRYASTNPAKALGFDDLGEIRKGNKANLIIVDEWFHVKHTIFEGAVV